MPLPLCIYNPLAKGLGNKSCAACDGLISVSPLGDLMPCSSSPPQAIYYKKGLKMYGLAKIFVV